MVPGKLDSNKNTLPPSIKSKNATIRKRQSERYIFTTNTTFTTDSSIGIRNPNFDEPGCINTIGDGGQKAESILYEEISPIPRPVTKKDDITLGGLPEDFYEVPIDGGTGLPQKYGKETDKTALGKKNENLYEISIDRHISPIIIPSRSGTLRNNIKNDIIKLNEKSGPISKVSNDEKTSPQTIQSMHGTLRAQGYPWKELPNPEYTEMNEDNTSCELSTNGQASDCSIIPSRNGTLRAQGYPWKELPKPNYTDMKEDNTSCGVSNGSQIQTSGIPSRQGYAWKELPDTDYTEMNENNTLYEAPVDSEISSRPVDSSNGNQSKTKNENLNNCDENLYEVLN